MSCSHRADEQVYPPRPHPTRDRLEVTVLRSVSQRTAVLMCAVAIVLTPASEAAGAQAVAAQEAVRTSGDAASRASVEARTRPIYEAATQHGAHQVFALVRDSSVGPDGSLGTEATGVVLDRAIGRIVASSWTATGKYSVEYLPCPRLASDGVRDLRLLRRNRAKGPLAQFHGADRVGTANLFRRSPGPCLRGITGGRRTGSRD